MTRLDDRPLLIVIASGPQQYREYVFASLATRYRVHLLHTEPPSWQKPFLVGSDRVDDFRFETLLPAAVAVCQRAANEHLVVCGVLCWDEARIHATARVAEALHLPCGDPGVIARCRDKYASRVAMAAYCVPQPAFALVGSTEEALARAAEIGYPVVLKPRAAAASYGVVLVRNAEDLARRFKFAYDATVPEAVRDDSPVLVEEYVSGPEVSVDSVVSHGVVSPVFVARKDVGFAPYFEEIGHLVAHGDPLLRDEAFLAVVREAHRAVGFLQGWTHTEFKLTSQGPKLVEVNARLGGDLIPYIGMRASGIDPSLLAGAAACGESPSVVADRDLVSGVRFFYAPHDNVLIESVGFRKDELPASIDRAVPLAAPGDRVRLPPKGLVSGRVAFATAIADTPQAVRSALDCAGAALDVRYSASSFALEKSRRFAR